MTVLTIDKTDPYRSFDWRAVRAGELADSQEPPAFELYDDSYVRRYAEVLKLLKVKPERYFRIKLPERLREAYNTHSFRNQAEGFSRHLLEAYLLSGCSNSQISEYFNMTPEGVNWYERTYFDVRSRLSKPMFILPRIFAMTLNGARNLSYNSQERGIGLVGSEAVAAIIKLFGYYGGPHVIEMLYTGLLRGPVPLNPDATKAFLSEALMSCVRVKGLFAIRAVDLNKFNIQGMVDSALSAVKADPIEGNITVMQNVQQFIDAASHFAGYPSQDMPENSLARDYTLTTVEPRSSELLSLAKGFVPEDLNRLIKEEVARA